jgi:type VI protein secretion system component VasF
VIEAEAMRFSVHHGNSVQHPALNPPTGVFIYFLGCGVLLVLVVIFLMYIQLHISRAKTIQQTQDDSTACHQKLPRGP